MPNTDEFIGVMISDVARMLRTTFDRRVRKLRLTRAQWLVLTRLHRRPGASQSESAETWEGVKQNLAAADGASVKSGAVTRSGANPRGMRHANGKANGHSGRAAP